MMITPDMQIQDAHKDIRAWSSLVCRIGTISLLICDQAYAAGDKIKDRQVKIKEAAGGMREIMQVYPAFASKE